MHYIYDFNVHIVRLTVLSKKIYLSIVFAILILFIRIFLAYSGEINFVRFHQCLREELSRITAPYFWLGCNTEA